jgi:hypothetical protein
MHQNFYYFHFFNFNLTRKPNIIFRVCGSIKVTKVGIKIGSMLGLNRGENLRVDVSEMIAQFVSTVSVTKL